METGLITDAGGRTTMSIRVVAGLAIVLALGFPAAQAAAPVPRESPDFAIVSPSGKAVPIASLKGQVVLIEFLLVKCPHCTRVAQIVDRLQGELGPRGFQSVGVAFDNGVSGSALKDFTQLFKLDFPVGSATSDDVDRYLGRAPMERVQVPQLVLIDRAGVIRAQSRPVGEMNLEDEAYLRTLIKQLLDEGGSTDKPG
jgi:peroxiredoxin